MATVNVNLPADLAAHLRPGHLSEEAACWLALEFFREEKVSLGRAAELCERPLATFMDFAASRGVSPLRTSFDDLEEERRSVERLGA